MTEFKIKLEDKIVQTIGYGTIEKFLNDYINQIILITPQYTGFR